MDDNPRKCSLGICVMSRKRKSKGMSQLLKYLSQYNPGVEVILFEDDMLHHQAVEHWPLCEYLIAFYSEGFPLQKAVEYTRLRRPMLLCNLEKQYDMLDRRRVLTLLEQDGIPYPETYVVDNCDDIVQEGDVLFFGKGGEKGCLRKPFIEKPLDAEDHNVWLYYASADGGGIRKLFRKTAKKSSEFHPGEWKIRRDGTYLYQRAYPSANHVDVKVYTVGPDYVYAESRKAPTVDGVVDRTPHGKEVREQVGLSEEETAVARKVARLMQQFVCGE